MSAKDKRKAILIHLPASLRPGLSRERARGRSTSAAAAMRRVVERGLAAGFADLGLRPEVSGQPYRLQLSAPVLGCVIGLARVHEVSTETVILQLLAAEFGTSVTAKPS